MYNSLLKCNKRFLIFNQIVIVPCYNTGYKRSRDEQKYLLLIISKAMLCIKLDWKRVLDYGSNINGNISGLLAWKHLAFID